MNADFTLIYADFFPFFITLINLYLNRKISVHQRKISVYQRFKKEKCLSAFKKPLSKFGENIFFSSARLPIVREMIVVMKLQFLTVNTEGVIFRF